MYPEHNFAFLRRQGGEIESVLAAWAARFQLTAKQALLNSGGNGKDRKHVDGDFSRAGAG